MSARRAARGFTLVDLLACCAVTGVLAALAWPSYNSQLQKARRADAVGALTRLQAAQEQLRATQGLYASDLRTLGLAGTSAQGLYTLAVDLTGPDSYRASATALAGSSQAGDHDCPQLALAVNRGFAELWPSARCWGR